ncbi:unnamed protein product [Mesocestoides corti]|uniref:Uncharacterized protein n=1 Tax=Mesocestoides corti TaxID=53468 RepID=A0A0R3UPX8_MESCO|nr:unnamed protein product [Mesocestoides corti]
MQKPNQADYTSANGVAPSPDASLKPRHQNSTDTTNPRSPRAPPLISKFRGEPPPSKSASRTPNARRTKAQYSGIFASTGQAAADRASFYVIHPEWSSEVESVSRVPPPPHSAHHGGHQVTQSATHQARVAGSGRSMECGILPQDRGPESVLSVARKAASHNPVWPHRCRSAPAQRTRNPIAWT